LRLFAEHTKERLLAIAALCAAGPAPMAGAGRLRAVRPSPTAVTDTLATHCTGTVVAAPETELLVADEAAPPLLAEADASPTDRMVAGARRYACFLAAVVTAPSVVAHALAVPFAFHLPAVPVPGAPILAAFDRARCPVPPCVTLALECGRHVVARSHGSAHAVARAARWALLHRALSTGPAVKTKAFAGLADAVRAAINGTLLDAASGTSPKSFALARAMNAAAVTRAPIRAHLSCTIQSSPALCAVACNRQRLLGVLHTTTGSRGFTRHCRGTLSMSGAGMGAQCLVAEFANESRLALALARRSTDAMARAERRATAAGFRFRLWLFLVAGFALPAIVTITQ